MATLVGIDLGTTYSAVARLDESGRPVIVHNSEGANITPSVVACTGPGETLVGEEARRGLDLDGNTFGRFKREMGSDQVYESDWDKHTPTSLSALVLRKLKKESEASIGSILEAVVTIPANFANEAREATLAAARDAGLNVKFIINEPTAAALYFAHHSGTQLAGTYAVYDLGGGTFDVTLVRVKGKDIEVLGTEGVSRLGGDDFDQKLQDLVVRKYGDQTGGALDKRDYGRNDAEEDKKSLSRRDKVVVRAAGSAGRANIEITRAEFEEAISALIAQTEMLCETVLTEAGVSPADISDVILAGGSTRLPAVRDSVERVFGKAPVSFGNPDEVVALGAALYAAIKTDTANLNAIQRREAEKVAVQEITSKYFGTISVGFNQSRNESELQNSVIIKKGEQIPCSVTEEFFTIGDGQTEVFCRVTEANSAETDPRFVKIIWEGNLNLPPGRPAGQQIDVSFAYDDNQVMRCAFVDVATGKRSDVDLSMRKAGDDGDLDIDKFIVD